MRENQVINEELFDFISKGKTTYHVVEQIKVRLGKEGFQQLYEEEDFEIYPGGKYYVIRGGSSLIGFVVPENEYKGYHIGAAHTDSPCFKVKENPELLEKDFVKLNVEKYGGMILSSWLDRPLSVAGRLIVEEEGELYQRLVASEKELVLIPNVAIHLNEQINKGYVYNPQTDMTPIYAQGSGNLKELMAKEIGVSSEQVLGSDLFVYNGQSPVCFGENSEFIGAPRLDDLQCLFGCISAFLNGKSDDYINVIGAFDHEEVGSETRQGAGGSFLLDVLNRINQSRGHQQEDQCKAFANSFLISADNAHGFHPNHPEKSDKSNAPMLNQGIVIKYNGQGKYITDGMSAAFVKQLCKNSETPFSEFSIRSDIQGGSTLGHMLIQNTSIQGADIGLAQLAMHSAFEMAGEKDTRYLIKMMEEFYGL